MAKLHVKIISKHMIKPSSPTPNHLKNLKLSFLDQFANPFFIPFIFFYRSFDMKKTITMLQQSLSETLVQFYPLAGRIEDDSSINCNDKGVAFYEANVLASIEQVIEKANPEELVTLLPFAPLSTSNTIVAGVQVNQFSSGGMAISVCISHKIADGATFVAFVNAWATKARGISGNDHQVNFDSVSLFPQIDLNAYGTYDPEGGICKEKIVTRRLVFDKEKLNTLKKQCDDGSQVRPPTRTEVVSAFLWKHFIDTAKAKATPPKIFGSSQLVNLRTINSSPIPRFSCGNLIWNTFAYAPVQAETKYPEAVAKIRTSVKRIDTDYIGKIQTGESFKESQKAKESFVQGQAEFCGFSSCIRFPVYEVDYGFGTPIWVSMTTLPFKNMVFLVSTKCGEGIEAWVNVLEQDITALDHMCMSFFH